MTTPAPPNIAHPVSHLQPPVCIVLNDEDAMLTADLRGYQDGRSSTCRSRLVCLCVWGEVLGYAAVQATLAQLSTVNT